MKAFVVALLAAVAAGSVGPLPAPAAAAGACTLDRATGTMMDATPFISGGDAAGWNANANLIVFVRSAPSGYDEIFTMRPDGSDVAALDARLPQVPRTHQGQPQWDPSGRLLVFTVQKADWHGRRFAGIPDYEALSGFGRHDDLWVASADGRTAVELTDEPDSKDEGVLVPVFSHDGKRLAWSQRLPGGKYEMRLADFVALPRPHLANVRTLSPGGPAYYETGSFSTDGGTLTYTSDQDTHSFFRSQIYALDLASGRARRLTTGDAYDEHPVDVGTPSGDWIVYMSSRGVHRLRGHLLVGTDWWAMRLDGSGTKRLSQMNVPGNPENTGGLEVAGRVAVTPDPAVLLGGVQDNLVKQTGSVRRIHLTCP